MTGRPRPTFARGTARARYPALPVRVATFNLAWFGTPETARIRRDAADEAMIVRALTALDADAIVFEEIVNLPLLEALVARVPGRRYRVRDDEGRWLTTGRMRRAVSHIQKLVLALDADRASLVDFGAPLSARTFPGPRLPLVARVRARIGRPLTLVGVHLKSGSPDEPMTAPESQVRLAECAAIARFVEKLPPGEATVVLGDLNAGRGHPSLAPLASLAGWTWHEPRLPAAAGESWTSFVTRTVIDHVLSSPAASARVVAPPSVYPFDLDSAVSPAEGPAWLRTVTDFTITPDEDTPPIAVENLMRVSDHRPIVVEIAD